MATGSALAGGPVTFVFTDVAGSTALWDQAPAAMGPAMKQHDALVEQAVTSCGGQVVKPRGEGDSTFAVFTSATEALRASVAIQLAIGAWEWPTPRPIVVRIAVHTGTGELRDGDYYGSDVNRCARLRGLAHAGQILVSQATADQAADDLRLRSLGVHRLRDLTAPESVYQVDHPDLPTEFPPPLSLDVVPNNLPVQVSGMVGREQAVREVAAALGHHRLITLTGLGGSGKTRLALGAAAAALDGFPGGTWFVELAPVTDPDLVPVTIATTLGVAEAPPTPMTTTIAERFSHQRALLVVDNCEHLVDGVARTVDALLRAAAGLTVLATSQEPLAVGGEHLLAVPPLDPDAAARLFLERASAANPPYPFDDATLAAVASICTRLDGIPLAIELAAARVRSLTPLQIAERLDDRFRLLTGGSRTAPDRHRTLTAALEWTHDLLSEPEQILYRRLGVFQGGASLDAIEDVCSGPDRHDRPAIEDLLSGLIDRSLLVLDPSSPPRYRMLETILHHARSKLDAAGERTAGRDGHLQHFARQAVAGQAGLRGRDANGWMARLRADHDNLRAALDWALTEGDPNVGLEAAAHSQEFWGRAGLDGEAVRWLSALIDRVPHAATATRALAGAALAQALHGVRRYDEAFATAQRADALARQSHDVRAQAATSFHLAAIELNLTGGRGGMDALDRAHDLFRDLGDEERRVQAVVQRALASLCLERPDEVGTCHEQIEAWAVSQGDTDLQVFAGVLHASTLLQRGELDTALTTSRAAVTLARERDDPRGLLDALGTEAAVQVRRGAVAEAAALLTEYLQLQTPYDESCDLGDLLTLTAELVAPQDPRTGAWLMAAACRGFEQSGLTLGARDEQMVARVVVPTRAALGDEFDGVWRAGAEATADPQKLVAVVSRALAQVRSPDEEDRRDAG